MGIQLKQFGGSVGKIIVDTQAHQQTSMRNQQKSITNIVCSDIIKQAASFTIADEAF